MPYQRSTPSSPLYFCLLSGYWSTWRESSVWKSASTSTRIHSTCDFYPPLFLNILPTKSSHKIQQTCHIHIKSSMCSIFSTVYSDIEFMSSLFSSYLQRSIISFSILSRIFFYFSHLIAPYCSTFLTSVLPCPSNFSSSLGLFIFYSLDRRFSICSALTLGSVFSSPMILPSKTLSTL